MSHVKHERTNGRTQDQKWCKLNHKQQMTETGPNWFQTSLVQGQDQGKGANKILIFELAFIRVDGKRGEKDKFQGALLLGAIKTYVQSQDDERYTWAQLFSNHCSEVLLHLSDAMCHSNMQHRSLVCSTC